MMRNIICMMLCLFAVIMLATSDGLINMSASDILGSTEESRLSFRAVALGVVIALLAAGAVVNVLNNKAGIAGVWALVLVTAIFSATLTIQGASIDYHANDKSGHIQKTVKHNNNDSIDDLSYERKRLNRKMDECARDNFYKACMNTERRIAEINTEIQSLRNQNVSATRSQQIDITDAVEIKTGIKGVWIERIGIYSRAIGVPFLISLMMYGFWHFFDLQFDPTRQPASKKR